MATRLVLRTALRERLEDTSGSPLWADAALNEALTEAMRQYGVRLPLASTATVNVLAGTTSYALPAGVTPRGIVQVLDGDGDTVVRDFILAGEASPGPANAGGLAQAWSAWGSTLYLARTPGTSETWTLRYMGGRELVADDVTSQPIDAGDEPIVLALALAWAWGRRAGEDIKRGGSGRGALAEEKRFTEMADDLVAARLRRARFVVIG